MAERPQRPPWLGEDKRTWDHVRVHIQLFQDARLDAVAIAVYGGIAVHAERYTGDAHPSQATLGSYIGRSWSTVHDALLLLERVGYIEITHREGRPSLYRLLPPPPIEPLAVGQGSEQSTSAPGAERLRAGRDATPGPDANEQEPGTKTSSKRSSGSAVPPGQPLDPMTRTQQAQRAIMEENMARMAAEEPPPSPEDRKRMAAEVHEANRQKLGR